MPIPAAGIITIAGLLLYGVMTGMSLATMRAIWMMVTFACGTDVWEILRYANCDGTCAICDAFMQSGSYLRCRDAVKLYGDCGGITWKLWDEALA